MHNYFGSAFILAGGKSERMPFDKQKITIGGKPIAVFIADILSDFFTDIYIISNTKAVYHNHSYRVIPDKIDGCGPLGGLYTALCHTASEYVYITGCDMPFVNGKYIHYMKEQLNNAAIPVDGILTTTNGLAEPLNAFYHKRLKDTVRSILAGGGRRMANLYKEKEMIYVPEKILKEFDPEYSMFFNLNTMEDYETLNSIIQKSQYGCSETELDHSRLLYR